MSKHVLDACCGSRMMWMDKQDSRVTFVDIRNEDYVVAPDRAHPKGTVISVRPDTVEDFRALSFDDASFWHVVFDPPHIKRNRITGTIPKKYGCLGVDWESTISAGFAECFRVLKPYGTLIFKWCEVEIPLSKVLDLTPCKPLYGHRSGKKAGTHWVAFMKEPESPTPVVSVGDRFRFRNAHDDQDLWADGTLVEVTRVNPYGFSAMDQRGDLHSFPNYGLSQFTAAQPSDAEGKQ